MNAIDLDCGTFDDEPDRGDRPPSWTLITVSFNNAAQLREYWSEPRPHGVEWIVVDNCSSDQSVAAAEAVGASRVLRLGRNCGFGFANNVGLSVATGKYIAFVNPDVRVTYDSLDLLAKAIAETGGLVAPQLENADGSLQPNGRGFPTLRNKISNRLSGRSPSYHLTASPGTRRYVCWAIGAAIAGDRTVFNALNSWDDRFFIYYEDSDLCLRAWQQGIPVQVDGDVVWTHAWARATMKFRLKPWAHEVASMLKFYTRYPALVWPEGMAVRRYARIHHLISHGAIPNSTARSMMQATTGAPSL